METLKPFIREQGSGDGVICLHSNASSSSQWRSLADLLSDRFHVMAVDGYGAGKSPEWPGEFPLRLADEVSLLDAALERAGERFHLIGHSYGGAVAMKAALMYPARVRSLVVYEPTLFHLVAAGDPLSSPAEGIWRASSDAAEAIARGDSAAAAERFIDFWISPGAWASMPAARQAGVASAMKNVKAWRDTLFSETFPSSALASLQIPVLLMWGEDSPESALSVARLLKDTLPDVTPASRAGRGHMGPITHAESVNAQISGFLDDL